MKALGRLAAYGLLLVAIGAGGAAVGNAVGPIDVDSATEHGASAGDGDHAGSDPGPADLPAGGLLVAQDGYNLQAPDRVLEARRPQPFSFVVQGPEGAPLDDYDLLHDKELHLIIVSSDLGQFAHLHPERADDGRWSVEVPALAPGSYRAFADFQPAGGDQLTLGTDLTVPGDLQAPTTLHERRTTTVDGYEVTLEGEPVGGTTTLTVTVRRDGAVVTTDPYLGAAGHLVAIRDGDLAYLHVHPIGDEPEGPVEFGVEFPSAGRYGVYFDFASGGAVHTAGFVLTADPSTPTDVGDHADDQGH